MQLQAMDMTKLRSMGEKKNIAANHLSNKPDLVGALLVAEMESLKAEEAELQQSWEKPPLPWQKRSRSRTATT
eukprot:1794262-Alexandrium_andersonii.AAC.1